MMKTVLSVACLVALMFSSCENKTASIEKTIFPSDTTVIGNDYPDISSELVLKIMEDLEFCTSNDTVKSLPPCTNQYFRVFKAGPAINLKDGFLLEMRAGLFNTPVKQLLLIQKGFNTYKIINQYFGFLIEQRTTKSGYSDLLMGYQDKEIGIVAIKHEWDGKRYNPTDVEEINGYYIKEELKDSINSLFIDNFYAGH